MASYDANIRIGVTGQQQLDAAITRIGRLQKAISAENKFQVIFDRGVAQSLDNYNDALRKAVGLINSVGAGTKLETAAIQQYVSALGEANAARSRQNKLIEEEIARRNQLKTAVQSNIAISRQGREASNFGLGDAGDPVAKSIRRQKQRRAREDRLIEEENAKRDQLRAIVQSNIDISSQSRGVSNFGLGSAGDPVAKSIRRQEERRARLRNRLLAGDPRQYAEPAFPGRPGSPQEAAGTYRAGITKFQERDRLNRELLEKSAFQELENIEKTAAAAIKADNKVYDNQRKLDDEYWKKRLANAERARAIETRNAKALQTYANPEGRRRELTRTGGLSFDERLARRRPDIADAKGFREARRLRASSLESGIIGGAFPLLFGQGIGGSVGGLAGGLVGGALGGAGGFAGSLAGTLIGAQFDVLKKGATDVAAALNEPVKALDALERAGIKLNAGLQDVVRALAETGRSAEAQAMIFAELERLGGTEYVQNLLELQEANKGLSDEWAQLSVTIQNELLPAFILLTEGIAGLVRFINENKLVFDILKSLAKAGISATGLGAAPVLLGEAGAAARGNRGETRNRQPPPLPLGEVRSDAQKQISLARELFDIRNQAVKLEEEAADITRDSQEKVIEFTRKRADLIRDIADFEKSIADRNFELRQKLAQIDSENLRKQAQIGIEREDLRLLRVRGTTGSPEAKALIDGVREYLRIRGEGEANLQQQERELKLEIASIEREVADFQLKVEVRMEQIRRAREDYTRDVNKTIIQQQRTLREYEIKVIDYQVKGWERIVALATNAAEIMAASAAGINALGGGAFGGGAGGTNTFQGVMESATRAGAKFPELVAAQWALESARGTSVSGRNNYFGQKGPGATKATEEVINGRRVTVRDSFMDFPSLDASVKYLVDKWYKGPGGANNAMTLASAAQSLKNRGYATDPDYVKKLLDIVRGEKIQPIRLGQNGQPIGATSIVVVPGLLDAKGRPVRLDANAASALQQAMAAGGTIRGQDINSAYRTAAENRAAGGAERSLHMSGLAMDVQKGSPTERWLRANAGRYGWAFNDYPGSHGGHIEFGRGGNQAAAARAANLVPVPEMGARPVMGNLEQFRNAPALPAITDLLAESSSLAARIVGAQRLGQKLAEQLKVIGDDKAEQALRDGYIDALQTKVEIAKREVVLGGEALTIAQNTNPLERERLLKQAEGVQQLGIINEAFQVVIDANKDNAELVAKLTKIREEAIALQQQQNELDKAILKQKQLQAQQEQITDLQGQLNTIGVGRAAGYRGQAGVAYEDAIRKGYTEDFAKAVAEATKVLEEYAQGVSDAQSIAGDIGSSLSGAIKAAVEGGNIREVFANLAGNLGDKFLEIALRPLQNLIEDQLVSLFTKGIAEKTTAASQLLAAESGKIAAQQAEITASLAASTGLTNVAAAATAAASALYSVAGSNAANNIVPTFSGLGSIVSSLGLGGSAAGGGFNPLGPIDFTAGNLIQGFAEGGRPPLDRPSWVGEYGPELFVPDVAGTVLSNRESREALLPSSEYRREDAPAEVVYNGPVLNFNGEDFVRKGDVPKIVRASVGATQQQMRHSTSFRKRGGI